MIIMLMLNLEVNVVLEKEMIFVVHYNWSNPQFINVVLAPTASDLLDPSSYGWDEFEIDYGVIQDKEKA